MRSRLLPLKSYLAWGHLTFFVVMVVAGGAMLLPFGDHAYFSPAYREHQLSLLPQWFGLVFQGHAGVGPYLVVAAYAVCVAGSVVVWGIQEQRAQRYVRGRRGH